MKYLKIIFIVVALILPLISSVQAAQLINEYDFDGNFNDNLGIGDPLAVFNTATNAFGVNGWSWTVNTDPGGGLILTTPILNPANYSIGIRFKYNEVGPSYRKIISFLDSTQDEGLYFRLDALRQYNIATGTNTFNADTFYDLVITRNSTDNNVKFYMVDNGVVTLEMDITDTGLETVPNNVGVKSQFLLFHDDTSTDSEWTTGGTVQLIRVWNGPLYPSEIQNALLQSQSISVPTMSQWGMVIFMFFAGLGSVVYLRRSKRAES